MSTLIFSLVDFEQVNVCWDVIKSLFTIVGLFFKYVMHQTFYWRNALMHNPFLSQNLDNINTRNTTK